MSSDLFIVSNMLHLYFSFKIANDSKLNKFCTRELK